MKDLVYPIKDGKSNYIYDSSDFEILEDEMYEEYESIRNSVYEDDNREDFMLFVRQEYIDAKLISLDCYGEDTIEFPWHGHSKEDFEKLNNRLIKAFPLFERCKNEKEINKIIQKYPDVYEAYFARTILCEKKQDGVIELDNDGRHRVYIAQQNNSKIPVIIYEYVNPDKVDFDSFKNRYLHLKWQF